MIFKDELLWLGNIKHLPGHVLIERLETNGLVLCNLRVTRSLLPHLQPGRENALLVQTLFGNGILLGVSNGETVRTIGELLFFRLALVLGTLALLLCGVGWYNALAFLAALPLCLAAMTSWSIHLDLISFIHAETDELYG